MKSCSIAVVVGQRRCVQELAREENGDGNCAVIEPPADRALDVWRAPSAIPVARSAPLACDSLASRQQGHDPTVAIPPVFAGQRNDVGGQSRLVVCHPGRVSLGASHLSQHTARPTLGNGQYLAHVPDRLTSTRRAQLRDRWDAGDRVGLVVRPARKRCCLCSRFKHGLCLFSAAAGGESLEQSGTAIALLAPP